MLCKRVAALFQVGHLCSLGPPEPGVLANLFHQSFVRQICPGHLALSNFALEVEHMQSLAQAVSFFYLVVLTILKNISQLGWLFPIYGKIKNVPNHQPVTLFFQRWNHSQPQGAKPCFCSHFSSASFSAASFRTCQSASDSPSCFTKKTCPMAAASIFLKSSSSCFNLLGSSTMLRYASLVRCPYRARHQQHPGWSGFEACRPKPDAGSVKKTHAKLTAPDRNCTWRTAASHSLDGLASGMVEPTRSQKPTFNAAIALST